MTEADRIVEALRPIAPGNKLMQTPGADEVDLINRLGALWAARRGGGAIIGGKEPPWVTALRTRLGEKEVKGPQHNGWIAKGWAALNASWFNTDETPWCGFAIAWAMDKVGLPYPAKGEFARALAWASYGVECQPQLGAIGVKRRVGGNHVFMIVGQTPDKRFYKCLGGNQGDAVSIMDIPKTEVFAIRWPPGVPQTNLLLPMLPPGIISRNEA